MTKAQLELDIIFLAKRASSTGRISFGGYRDTGLSSDSIVAIAYGIFKLKDQYFPSDLSDMISCRNMWKKIPKHRKTGDGLKAFRLAEESDYYGKIKINHT